MSEIKQRKFLRKTVKMGNSCGVLLPKSVLGSDVRVTIVRPPMNPEKDLPRILEKELQDILGIYIVKQDENKAVVLAVSEKLQETISKGRYKIDVVPLTKIKKGIKEHKETRDKIKNAKVVINKKLLAELRAI